MAIISSKPISKEANYTDTSREYRWEWVVIGDSRLSEFEVVTDDSTPNIGDLHPDDLRAKVTEMNATSLDPQGDKTWRLSIRFAIPDYTEYDNPLDVPVKISYGSNQYTVVADKAWDETTKEFSKPVQNSAGDLFDPPAERVKSRPVITIVQNVALFDVDWIRQFEDTINKEAMTIAGFRVQAEEARMLRISATTDTQNGIDYYTVTYAIETDKDGFEKSFLDQGFSYIEDGKKFAFTDVVKDTDGNTTEVPSQDPRKLNGTTGEKLADGADPKYLSFQTYEPKSWKTLSLPVSAF